MSQFTGGHGQKVILVYGICNNLNSSENHLVRVPAELPILRFHTAQMNDTDPFQSSDSATDEDSEEEETDEETDSD